MEPDHPGFPARIHLALETTTSFILNGAAAGILSSASSSLGLTVPFSSPTQPFTPALLARALMGLPLAAYLGFLEFFFNVELHADWQLHYGRPLDGWCWLGLGALRSAGFFVGHWLASRCRSAWTGPLRAVISRPPWVVSVVYGVFVLKTLLPLRPRMSVMASDWSLAKLYALLASFYPQKWLLDQKLEYSADIIAFPNSPTGGKVRLTPRYRYAPMPQGKCIRLLKLEVVLGRLRCTLKTAEIDKAPPYWALSYIWGTDQMDMCSIELSTPDGPRLLPITFNCATAIQSLVPFETRYLWIDAICINQQDVAEKQVQLPLMPDIYTKATLVVGHLGAKNTFPVGHFVARLRQNMARGKGFEFDEFDPSSPDMWEAVFGMLSQLYWGRAWVFQEVALARSLLLVYGTECVCWEHMAQIAKHAVAGDSSVLPSTVSSDNQSPSNLRAFQAFAAFGLFAATVEKLKSRCRDDDASQRPTLAQVIDVAFPREATDPRDAVYALLGLCSDASAAALKPVYAAGLSCEEAYTNVSLHYLLDGGCINLLLLAGLAYREPAMRLPSTMNHISGFLPSWVPDLALQTEKRLGSWAAERERQRECRLECHVCPRRRVLSVRGRRVDTILAVSGVQLPGDLRRTPGGMGLDQVFAYLDHVYSASLKLAEKYVPDPYPTGRSRDDAHWRTLIMDHDNVNGSPAAPETRQIFIELFTRQGRDSEPVETGRETDEVPTRGWGMRTSAYTFAVTDGGYMAMVPPGSRKGDVVCIFEGCIVPFVLRPTGDALALWGDGYVQGFMHGEADGLVRTWFNIV